MRLARIIGRWFYVAFIAVAAWAGFARLSGEKATFAPYFFAVLLPLAAGTGLMTAARRGQLDLLFGTGETRMRVWRTAFCWAWLIPSVMVAFIFALSGEPAGVLIRTPGLLLFSGGVAFALGLIEMRYTLGVLWMLSRVLFFLTGAALDTAMALSQNAQTLSRAALAGSLLAVPELLVEEHVPWPFVVGAGVIGVVAIAGSYFWFASADLGGKRT